MASAAPGAWAFARAAADRIVGGKADDSVVRGVLAQWIAENGWGWPPARRNPGNLSRGWAASFNYPFTVQTPNPQPSNPIVTFATLSGGAYCYADGIRAFPRYNRAQAKAVAGDGLGFAVALCDAGYGTNASTVRSVYAILGNPPKPAYGHAVTTARLHLRTGAGRRFPDNGPILPVKTALVVYSKVKGGSYPCNGTTMYTWLHVKAGTRTGYVAAGFTKETK